jgi:hypothetical protein
MPIIAAKKPLNAFLFVICINNAAQSVDKRFSFAGSYQACPTESSLASHHSAILWQRKYSATAML